MMNEDFLRKLREEGKLELSDPIKSLKSMEMLYSMGYVFNGAEWVKGIDPRTKVMYEKVLFNSIWEGVRYVEEGGELYIDDQMGESEHPVLVGNVPAIMRPLAMSEPVYRKVEKDIDWQVEAETFRKSSELKYYDMEEALNFPKDHCMTIDFVKMCHLVASLTDKPE